jgi:hypothetical protein
VFSDKELEAAEQVLGDRLELHGYVVNKMHMNQIDLINSYISRSNIGGSEEKAISHDTPLSVVS